MDQVRLVGVAALGGELVPAGGWVGGQAAPHRVEADQAGGGLGRQADLLGEPSDQVLVAPADLAGQPADRQRAAGGGQPPPRPGDLRGGVRAVLGAPQQVGVQQPEPSLPAWGVAELVGQAPTALLTETTREVTPAQLMPA
jgi:hypothetical protein